jgi:HSP20 family molecular chaperone IbpA
MTNLTRIDPFAFPMTASVDKLWDTFFDGPAASRPRGLSYEIKSEDDAVIAEVEVPGVAPTDVKVKVEGRAVHVETPRGNAYFTIGARVDGENVSATLRHGLLALRVPKREAKTVQVKVVDLETGEEG